MPRFTAFGIAGSYGSWKWAGSESAASTSDEVMPPFVPTRLSSTLIRSVGNASASSVWSASRRFLSVGMSGPLTSSELVGAVERAQHRPVEVRRRVDDDDVVHLQSDVEQSRDLFLGDEVGLLRPLRRGEHVDARAVTQRERRQLLGVELARSRDHVVQRLFRLEAEHDRHVAELDVQVEQQHALALDVAQVGGEVRRRDRLSGSALGREDRQDPPAHSARPRRGAWDTSIALRIAKETLS